jgi:hypothetical protein
LHNTLNLDQILINKKYYYHKVPNQSLCVCVYKVHEWMGCSIWVLTSFSTFVMGIAIYGNEISLIGIFVIFSSFFGKKVYTWKVFNQNYNIKKCSHIRIISIQKTIKWSHYKFQWQIIEIGMWGIFEILCMVIHRPFQRQF